MTTTFNFSDSASTAIMFATKLLAGTLNFFHDWKNDCPFREVTVDEPWFSTKVIGRLRCHTCDNEISRLILTDITENPNSMGDRGEVRSATLFANDRRGRESELATFDVERDFVTGEYATGWTRWCITNVVVKTPGGDVALDSQPLRDGLYLSDVIWGEVILP